MAYRVFICYRRGDKHFARNIERELRQHFGDGKVFLDTDEIGGGQRWKEKILEAFQHKPVVVTLITKEWNPRRSGKPKLLDENDHIRFELETALAHGLLIVPVLDEAARWPKPNEIPPSLHAVLDFQSVPVSSSRWDYDMERLAKALADLGVPSASEEAATNVRVEPGPLQTGHIPLPQGQPPRSGYGQVPGAWTRAMFSEDPEERKARLARAQAAAQAERERKQRLRAEADPFYARWEFWVASIVTVMGGAGAVLGAELLSQTIAKTWISLPKPPILAGVVLVFVWASARIGMGAAAYWDDPSSARLFYLRGLLGGYTLWIKDFEPVGLWTAFPIATVLSWCLARGIAWPAYHYLDWSYDLIFWLVLGTYTLVAVFGYLALTFDEIF